MNPMVKRKDPAGAHCHILVAKTAQGMARECYDSFMQANPQYAAWRDANPGMSGEALESRWVATRWGMFVEPARATLAEMLRQPIDEGLKKQISEALILDAQLIRGRKRFDGATK